MILWEMIAIVAVVAIIAGVVKQYLERTAAPEVDLSGIEGRLDALEALEERVQVLEAIVTDKGYDLKTEIENLK